MRMGGHQEILGIETLHVRKYLESHEENCLHGARTADTTGYELPYSFEALTLPIASRS